MIRLLLIIDELDIGGTEQQMLELVKRLDQRKYQLLVCCFRPGRVADEIAAAGVRVIVIKKRTKFDPLLLWSLWRLIRRERIDLVQTYLFTANTWGRLAAILARVPIIVSSERNVDMWEEKYKRVLGKVLDRRTACTIANSQAVKDYLVGKDITPTKVHIICNGVDLQRFDAAARTSQDMRATLGIPAHHAVVALLVRLEPQKDPCTFLHAAALLAQKKSDVSFLVVGGGSIQKEVERQARELGLGERIIFTGPRRDVPQLLAICNVSILSSLKEGMSNTILESMAAGKPMVATRVGGNAELILDGETGFLTPTGEPVALAAAIEKLLDDPVLAEQMGTRARARIAQHFSAPVMAQATERLYDTLVRRAPALVNIGDQGSKTNGAATEREYPALAFIVSQFPRYVDAYFLREVSALAERGLRFQIFSLRGFAGTVVHQEARALLPRTVYLPFFFSWRLLSAHLYFLMRTPGRYMATLWMLLRGCWRSPRAFVRTLAVFPKSVAFARLVQRQQIPHIHANWASHPAASALVISRLTGVPWSFTGHASDMYLDTTMLPEKIQAARFIVTCTQYNKGYLTCLAGADIADKITVSYHGVDLNAFVPIVKQPAACVRLLAVGTLLECKGLSDLITACRLLADRGIAFTCTIAGDGPERRALEQQIRNRNLTAHVHVLGYLAQEDLIPLYQQADMAVLPALSATHFGIPNVLLEAMAVQTPVVCTPLPSLTEVIEDGVHGIYVPEHSPETLADTLEMLARDPQRRRVMGEAGRRRIEELFDTKKTVDVLEALFCPRTNPLQTQGAELDPSRLIASHSSTL